MTDTRTRIDELLAGLEGKSDGGLVVESADFIRSLASLAKVGLDAQWRTIDSAPKDEPIFLWPSSSGRSFYGYWNDGSGSWSRYLDIEYRPQEPTRWMPLPKPPTAGDVTP